MQNPLSNYLKTIELFLKGAGFYRGCILTISVVIPLALFYTLGYIEYAPSLVVGAFLNAPSDIAGRLRRKINGILVSIALTMTVTFVMFLVKPYFLVLIGVIAIFSFSISLLSAYGFRASLVAFSGLLSIVLALAVDKVSFYDISTHVVLMGVGGLWYLLVSLIAEWVLPKKDADQFLLDTLVLTGKYLKVRAKLLTKPKKRELFMTKALVLQTQITEKHETLRELLFNDRKRTGRSLSNERRLLVFISLVDIFELALANTLDYSKIDALFLLQKKHLKAFKKMNKVMGEHLIILSEFLLKKGKMPELLLLNNTFEQTSKSIDDYVSEVTLPKAREGAISLRNLHDYQKQLLQEVKAIQRALGKGRHNSKKQFLSADAKHFLTLQDYKFNILLQHFSMQSPILRHALRLSIAIVFGFVLGSIFDIKNAYWIVLTILVIMRPNYGLTKERSKHRIIGTIIGAIIATIIILITQNTTVYMILAIISLTFAFSLIQQNYKAGAAFVTLNIVFVYALIDPDAFSVIQYRVIDTIFGAAIAVLANYVVFPSWEFKNLDTVILNGIKANNAYLNAVKKLYHDKGENTLNYKLCRKEAFIAISNLNAAFQRLTQDPKSKQKDSVLVYDIVTLNHTILSAIASIGNYVLNHDTTKASQSFDIMVESISVSLKNSILQLENSKELTTEKYADVDTAKQKLLNSFEILSEARDKDIEAGQEVIDEKMLQQLQESHLISNQLIWLKTLSGNLKKITLKYKAIFK